MRTLRIGWLVAAATLGCASTPGLSSQNAHTSSSTRRTVRAATVNTLRPSPCRRLASSIRHAGEDLAVVYGAQSHFDQAELVDLGIAFRGPAWDIWIDDLEFTK